MQNIPKSQSQNNLKKLGHLWGLERVYLNDVTIKNWWQEPYLAASRPWKKSAVQGVYANHKTCLKSEILNMFSKIIM